MTTIILRRVNNLILLICLHSLWCLANVLNLYHLLKLYLHKLLLLLITVFVGGGVFSFHQWTVHGIDFNKTTVWWTYSFSNTTMDSQVCVLLITYWQAYWSWTLQFTMAFLYFTETCYCKKDGHWSVYSLFL